MAVNDLGISIYDSGKKSLSIYIHIPFCVSKCKYCAFVSTVATEDDKKRYFVDLLNEIKMQSKLYASNYSVSSIYIGGGTPSCLDYYYIRDLLSCLYKNFAIKNTAEITIEINPNSADKTKIREYILSGINRFSIGLQSINPKILKEMGRTHTVEDFQRVVSEIREYGIKNISADLILGYPGQKLSDIKEVIQFLIRMQIPHISTYMLQVENNTPLKTLVDNGAVSLPNEDTVVEMYDYIYNTLSKNGFSRYELSNFAKPTYESYHNSVYWKRKDYLGIGLAAHSYIDGTRFANTENIIKYANSIETKQEIPIEVSKNLTIEEKKEEFVMLSLRTKEGIDLVEYKTEFDDNLAFKKKDTIAGLIKMGYLILTNDNHLICTNKGFLVLNKLILELVDGDDIINDYKY